jgi:hypothetical protein
VRALESSTIADEQPDWHRAHPLAEPGAWQPLSTLTASTAVDGGHGSRVDVEHDRSDEFVVWLFLVPARAGA